MIGMEADPNIGQAAGLEAVGAVKIGGAKPETLYQVENWRGVKKRFVSRFWYQLRRVLGWTGLIPNDEYDFTNAFLVWREEFHNIVVTAGKNKLLDATLKTGLAAPLWYVGIKDTGTVAAADTMGSHAGWVEMGGAVPLFSNATRPAFTPGSISAGSVDNSASKAVFNIDATDDAYGAFLTDSATLDGTTGTLYGAGDFAAPRSVLSGDTLNVAITASIS